MSGPLSKEQVNRIVERVVLDTVAAGASIPEEEDFREWALETGFDAEWDGVGTVVPENLVPPLDPDYVHFMNGHLPKPRISELEDGAAPSSDEAKLFRDAWLDAMCLDGEADADVIPGYAWHTLTHSDGRTCVAAILAKGYSFSGVEYRWLGFYSNIGDLYRALRGIGHLDVDRRERRRRNSVESANAER